MMPRILARKRLWPLAGLAALGLGEAGLLVGTALSLSRVIADQTADALAASAGFALATALIAWARYVLAEDFGMRYANEVRAALAEHAVAVAGADRPRRLGAMAVRMTSDLNAQREWAALGIGEAVASAASSAAGLVILSTTFGWVGFFAALAAAGPAILVSAVVFTRLGRAHQRLRVERGRVSSLVGDLVLAAPALARFGAGKRETTRLAARSDRLRAAAVQRRRLAALMAAPAFVAPAAGVGTAAMLDTSGQVAALDAGGWAAIMLGLGLLANSLGGWARVADWLQAFRAASQRMRQFDEELRSAQANGHTSIDAETTLWIDRLTDVARQARMTGAEGEGSAASVVWVDAGSSARAVDLVGRLAHATVGSPQPELADALGQPPERLKSIARISSPQVPLLRASLRRNLSLRRRQATDADLLAALATAGLPAPSITLDERIEPALDRPDPFVQARLRLARCVAHKPRIIFCAEPTLLLDADYRELMLKIAHASKAIVVAPTRTPAGSCLTQGVEFLPG